MKKVFYLIMLFIVLTSCNNEDNGEEIFNPQVITPIAVAMRFHTGSLTYNTSDKCNLIFTNEEEWNSFRENYWLDASFPSTEHINFNLYMLIVVVDEQRPTAGYGITIYSVTEYQNNIVIDVVYSGNGGIGQDYARPFIAVKIPKTEKPIVFE